MPFARRVFGVAGIYGLLVLVPQYWMEERLGREDPPALTHPEFFYGFIGVALAWQVAFLLIARDPVRYRLLMIPSALEKAAFGIATLVLFAKGRVSGTMLAAGVVDLVWGALFVAAYHRSGSPGDGPARGRMGRLLTSEESRILEMIRSHYGPQNTTDSITWMSDDEATLWVTDATGAMVVMAHLTNLASWRLDGTIATDEELRRDWLQMRGT